MASVDADLSSGAKGIACDAVTAARPRPIANAEIARIFMDFPFSLMDDETDRLNEAKPVTANHRLQIVSNAREFRRSAMNVR
jgi:hypothetical protein